MPEPTFTLDTKAFEAALREYRKRSSRTLPVVINAAALDVVFKASEATRKADKGKVGAQLREKVWLASRPDARKGKAGKTRRRLVSRAVAIVAGREAKSGRSLSPDAFRTAVRKMIAARQRSVGYIAYAGWNNALVAMGGRGFGSKGKVNPRSKAARGFGTPAREGHFFARIANDATGAEKIGRAALQTALNHKALEMAEHAARPLQKDADALKGR